MTQTLGPIAYLTGEYPRATDTFIQREVMGLRSHGQTVHTCSIRKTGAQHLVGDEQIAEARNTFYILNAAKNPLRLLRAKTAVFLRSPSRFFKTLALAWRSSPAGFKAHLYQLFYFAEAMVLADHLHRLGVTHLHNHIAKSSCTVAMLTSELSGIPYSFTLHGPDIFFEPQHWRLDLKIRHARFVACISDFCRSQAMAFSAPKDWDKLHIVHCGVEPERYGVTRAAQQENPHLTFVGRLAAVKGLPVLFAALTEIRKDFPNVKVTLIGDGPERQTLEQDARAAGLADVLEFTGYRSQSEVAQMLGHTDMLVLPSFAEGVPVVLMEAMAAGLPVVTTRIAGIPELVGHETHGLLVAPGNVEELTAAIGKLLADPQLRQTMGAAARAKVAREFNVQSETRWLAELFSSYGSGKNPAAKRPKEQQP